MLTPKRLTPEELEETRSFIDDSSSFGKMPFTEAIMIEKFKVVASKFLSHIAALDEEIIRLKEYEWMYKDLCK